jgi:hypothetical protein
MSRMSSSKKRAAATEDADEGVGVLDDKVGRWRCTLPASKLVR